MEKIFSWYKKAKHKVTTPPDQNSSRKRNGAHCLGDQLKIFLYELEKKLIRLEVSLRRLRHDPSAIEQFTQLLNQIIEEMEATFTDDIRTALDSSATAPMKAEEYQRILDELRSLLNHLRSQLEEQRSSTQIMGRVQDEIKTLLDRQIARSAMSQGSSVQRSSASSGG